MLRRHLMSNLHSFDRHAESKPGLKQAGVAVVVTYDGRGEPSFVLTKRAPRLNSHSGQWALPGGRLDHGETPVQAALRETEEEVGLTRHHDDVLGALDAYPTRSGYSITPIVVWGGPDLKLTPNPGEVASIHLIRFRDLDQDDAAEFDSIPESDRPLIRLRIAGTKVHAPTAAMLYQFREVALNGRATRVAELEQPVWAWQ